MSLDGEDGAALDGDVVNGGAAEDSGADPQFTEVEQLAMEMGWKPKGQGVSDDKWKPAGEWLKVERDINRSLKQEMKAMREQVSRMAEASSKQTERALQRQAAELQAQFEAAVANRDSAGAARAVKELQELEREAVNSAPTANVEQDFATRNPWYGKDDEATAYAVAVSQREAAKGKSHSEQIAAVEEAMRKRFPELFGSQQAKVPAAVNAPGRSTPAPRKRGFADMPAEVKRAAENYAKLFKDRHGIDPEKSKAEYAEDYWAGQAA